MVLILDDSIAVYETTTGDLLWKKEHNVYSRDPFITETITGFFGPTFLEVKTLEQSSVYFYDTASGDLIATLPMPKLRMSISCRSLKPKTKGSCVCFWDDVTVHVIKVDGNKVQRYEFPFPADHFVKTMPYSDQADTVAKVKKVFSPVGSLVDSAGPCRHVDKASPYRTGYDTIEELFGFVGKTNILLGSARVNEWQRKLLFSLDLDAAMAAACKEEEVIAAFNLPLAHEWTSGSVTATYKPLFRLDRTKVGLELVGLTREEEVWERGTKYSIDSCYFVTEMEYPNE